MVNQHRRLLVELDHALIVITHTGRVMAEDDIVWRRPSPEPDPAPCAPGYPGPPRGTPAPPDWRPPLTEPITPPRHLPPVDHAAVDEAEQKASRFTYLIGLTALALLLLVACAQLL